MSDLIKYKCILSSTTYSHLMPDNNKVYSTEKSDSTKCRPRNPNQMFL